MSGKNNKTVRRILRKELKFDMAKKKVFLVEEMRQLYNAPFKQRLKFCCKLLFHKKGGK